jgi:hypothetical protein
MRRQNEPDLSQILAEYRGRPRPGQRPEQRPHQGLEPASPIPPIPPALGTPIAIAEVARLIGCSPWTVRQRLIPKGMPYFRAGASGKLIFYTNQVIRWIEKQQERRNTNI